MYKYKLEIRSTTYQLKIDNTPTQTNVLTPFLPRLRWFWKDPKVHPLPFINTPSLNLCFFNKISTPSPYNYLTESNTSGHNLCKNSHCSLFLYNLLITETFKIHIEKCHTSARCLPNGRRFSVHYSCIGNHVKYLPLITMCFILTERFDDSHYGLERDMHIWRQNMVHLLQK